MQSRQGRQKNENTLRKLSAPDTFPSVWKALLISATTLALYRYVEKFSQLCSDDIVGSWSQVLHTGEFQNLTAIMGLYLLAFARFLKGDEVLLEIKKQLGDSGSRPTAGSQAVDDVALLSHAVVFVVLGIAVTEPETFVLAFSILLIINSAWLQVVISQEVIRTVESESDFIALRFHKVYEAARRWALINFFTFLALLFSFLTFHLGTIDQDSWLALSLTICFLNSVADLCLTWWVYFKPLRV